MAEKATTFVVRFRFFGLVTCKPEDFVDRLEKLCREYTDSPRRVQLFSWDTDFAP